MDELNRLECLEINPKKIQEVTYLMIIPALFAYMCAFLLNFFSIPLNKETISVPLLIFIFLQIIYLLIFLKREPEKGSSSFQRKKDINLEINYLENHLEKTVHFAKQGIAFGIAISVIILCSFPLLVKEFGQLTSLGIAIYLFFNEARFRNLLHLYTRTSSVSDEKINNRYSERAMLTIFAWGCFFAFVAKSIFLTSKVKSFWDKCPNFYLGSSFLVLGFVIFLTAGAGYLICKYKKSNNCILEGLISSCVSLGVSAVFVWFYPVLHSFLFLDIPSCVIQMPLFLWAVITSVGVFFSFQSNIQKKILGSSLIDFSKNLGQVIFFLALWRCGIIFANLTPAASLAIYGLFIMGMKYVLVRKNLIITTFVVVLVGILPFLVRMISSKEDEMIDVVKSHMWSFPMLAEKKKTDVSTSHKKLV